MATIRVQTADFDIGAEFVALTAGRTDIGGIGCFVGTVRSNAGDRVAAMTLEHYPAMTERAIARITAEAERRWGGTEAWTQSQRRAAAYTKQDWLEIQAEADAINRDLAAAMTAGTSAADPRAMDLAELHRQHITRWFYDCTYEMHRSLAEIYVADERFTQTYDAIAPGLARYTHDAVLANADPATP